MSGWAIRAEGLGKRFFKEKRGSPLQALKSAVSFASPVEEAFWALRGVDFEITAGDAVGVIGSNGAGKTTLLKVLSRITSPSEGLVRMRGRVTPLLGVGTGFVPSLSGRENIFLNASIMGMSRRETLKRFDEIVDFAGVGEFIDMPVRFYSSGMYSRLAFSVAAHIVSDILLVDEVLSVGDAAFQKKSMDRMNSLMGSGRTVLFVSHSMGQVLKFCRKVLWLEKGRLVAFGEAREVAGAYMKSQSKSSGAWSNPAPGWNGAVSAARAPMEGSGAVLLSFELLDGEGRSKDIFAVNEPVRVRLRYRVLNPRVGIVPSAILFCAPRHAVDNEVCAFATYDWRSQDPRPAGDYEASFTIPPRLLNDGEYHFSAALVSPGGKLMKHEEHGRLVSFRVIEANEPERLVGSDQRGVVRPDIPWTTRRVASEEALP
jgi:lipopolysaccharide transport system ATP-binding protein